MYEKKYKEKRKENGYKLVYASWSVNNRLSYLQLTQTRLIIKIISNSFYAKYLIFFIPEEEFWDDDSSRDFGREPDQQVDNPGSHFHQLLKNSKSAKKTYERTNIQQ